MASARRPKEVPAHAAVGPQWNTARTKELDSYQQHDVYEVVHETEATAGTRVTSMRWVYTWKDDGSEKARLTIRGDCETRHLKKTGQALPERLGLAAF